MDFFYNYPLLFLGIGFALSGLFAIMAMMPLLHAWQLEAYKIPQFYRYVAQDKARIRKNFFKNWLWAAIGLVLALVLSFALSFVWPAYQYCIFYMAAANIAVCIIAFVRYRRQEHKKKLVFTARIKRLMSIMVLLSVLISIVVLLLASPIVNDMIMKDMIRDLWAPELAWPIIAVLLVTMHVALVLTLVITPHIITLAGRLATPIERAVTRWYFNDGKKKLASHKDMIKIGITGSYGKTSCKVILGTILSEKYHTLITPHSYNTPMGVTRVIRNQMTGDEEVFVAEMGARNVGDIAEMCDLVAPTYGLLTSVGPQHLETFGSIENVAKTKYELIDCLPEGGKAFLPDDGGICKGLYDKTEKEKYLFAIDGEGLYMKANDITLNEQGSSFVLCCAGGESIPCTTKLLGRHNIQNILGCAAIARRLGLTMQQIADGIGKVEAVEHRLQLIPTGNGVTVIDDAFNSNPAGTQAALDVLGGFAGRKIIITPGLVELGDVEYEENVDFGRRMAKVVDIAILVAGNGDAIEKGLKENGYPEANIIRAGNLNDATAALSRLTRIGDVVLFENDLPDHYEH